MGIVLCNNHRVANFPAEFSDDEISRLCRTTQFDRPMVLRLHHLFLEDFPEGVISQKAFVDSILSFVSGEDPGGGGSGGGGPSSSSNGSSGPGVSGNGPSTAWAPFSGGAPPSKHIPPVGNGSARGMNGPTTAGTSSSVPSPDPSPASGMTPAVVAMNKELLSEIATSVFKTFNVTNDGFMDFNQYIAALSLLQTGATPAKLTKLFEICDLDHRNAISAENVTDVLRCGKIVQTDPRARVYGTEEVASQIVRKYDKDLDGQLSMAEFLAIPTTEPSVHTTLKQLKSVDLQLEMLTSRTPLDTEGLSGSSITCPTIATPMYAHTP